jgi:hypothetical protein
MGSQNIGRKVLMKLFADTEIRKYIPQQFIICHLTGYHPEMV